jgi:hypothetical protein
MRLAHLWLIACGAGVWIPPAPAQQITWQVTFADQPSAYSAYYDRITSHIQAAGARWGQVVQPAANVTVVTRVEFTTAIPRSSGRSLSSSYLGSSNGMNLYEQGVGTMIRVGADPNGAQPDVIIEINPNYMQHTLWWDPSPTTRSAPVDPTKTDAMSVMLHELGHAIAFNGWRNHTTGALPGNYLSTFDRHVTFDGQNLFFTGPEAVAVYGGAVPVTYGNNFHLGNDAPRPGQDLIPDLMNGVVFYDGWRYDISALDRAILADSGLPVTPVPEPGLIVAVGAVVVGVTRRRKQTGRQTPGRNPQ